MTKIINVPLETHNNQEARRFASFANESGCELFFAVGVNPNTKHIELFFNNAGGIERVIETAEIMLRDIKRVMAEKKSRG